MLKKHLLFLNFARLLAQMLKLLSNNMFMNVAGQKWVYFFCVFCVLTTSCNRKVHERNEAIQIVEKQQPREEKTIKSDTGIYIVLKLERTGCYGNCPVYTALLRSDGTAQFVGSNNVSKLGSYVSVASINEIKDIKAKLQQIDFFSFAEHYPLNKNYLIPDLPYTYITVSDGARIKRIADNYDSPENLQWFEKELDEFFNQLNWTKIKD